MEMFKVGLFSRRFWKCIKNEDIFITLDLKRNIKRGKQNNTITTLLLSKGQMMRNLISTVPTLCILRINTSALILAICMSGLEHRNIILTHVLRFVLWWFLCSSSVPCSSRLLKFPLCLAPSRWRNSHQIFIPLQSSISFSVRTLVMKKGKEN